MLESMVSPGESWASLFFIDLLHEREIKKRDVVHMEEERGRRRNVE